jgi:uncharacterized tellurite resistance protein B-like protein
METNDNNCREDYTYEKFVLYLYLLAAEADYQLQDEEVDIIKEKVTRNNFISPEAFDKTFHQVIRDYKNHNDFESLNHIQNCCRDLHLDKDARQKIYKDFQEIVMADGKEDDSERINMFKFRKMLGIEDSE